MMQKTVSIYDLSLDELISLLKSWDEPDYRAHQIWEGLYKQYWSSTDEFSILPKELREKLGNYFSTFNTGTGEQPNLLSLLPVRRQESSDRETVKTLFSIAGSHKVEAVLMRYAKRCTLCISTQAGCAMGCVFCATGQMGFKRQLTSGEIIEQVIYYAHELAQVNKQVTNIVVMGMGEPFHNYEATMAAIDRLNHPEGYNLGARRFTISTVGMVPGIRRFTNEHRQINLAISLHAADDNLRSELLPINNKYPLDELFSSCLEYVKVTHRRISFEWALIHGKNDTSDQAHLLTKRLRAFQVDGSTLCHVNVIPLNPTNKYGGHASTHQRAVAFQSILEQAGIPCTIRLRRGIDIQAGCGQLAGQNLLLS
jgi:23S rRNA (adenine2503-C2)-methyltransferase